MATEPNNPHDLFFKQYLSHPEAAADFLRQHLPTEVASLLHLTQLALALEVVVLPDFCSRL